MLLRHTKLSAVSQVCVRETERLNSELSILLSGPSGDEFARAVAECIASVREIQNAVKQNGEQR